MENVKDFKNSATQALRDSADGSDMIQSFRDKYHELEEQARAAADSSVSFVRKYPVYSVLGAVTVGAILGALIRRM